MFVYRTIEDLEQIISYAKENNVHSAAVLGGGLLGLEAAKAVKDLNVTAHIVEYAPILMARQIDQVRISLSSYITTSINMSILNFGAL